MTAATTEYNAEVSSRGLSSAAEIQHAYFSRIAGEVLMRRMRIDIFELQRVSLER